CLGPRQSSSSSSFVFLRCLFTPSAPSEFYTLSLHDALPISFQEQLFNVLFLDSGKNRTPVRRIVGSGTSKQAVHQIGHLIIAQQDRKSTRLNSSHVSISYAVFCLKKKNQ